MVPHKCSICKNEYTTLHTEAAQDVIVYACSACLEAAKYNFIWICMKCGEVYLRPKKLVIERLKNKDLKGAYTICEDMQMIQGIDMCISCSPDVILDNYVNKKEI